MGKQKIAITLDEGVVAFLNRIAPKNRSEYVNNLLRKQEKQTLKEELIKALREDIEDSNYQQEIAHWDRVVGDGIDGEG
ncbi:CopG family transcriptional regulator [Crocosphaera sp. XPORK-15E]|uniref:type II toxin-antitoxin system MazE family antitoxin n=1 Tax=Crocosphaera sp. XPORK-15E TaxID=3110247 RepID=UPI002B1FB5CD|nr:CopG family transcriptional regulator [Crocosphaera sp. XPORK-15E]MEA5533063.1 CopG family transcriptional regulator [Crocosphaera sp. XPORK-15E]